MSTDKVPELTPYEEVQEVGYNTDEEFRFVQSIAAIIVVNLEANQVTYPQAMEAMSIVVAQLLCNAKLPSKDYQNMVCFNQRTLKYLEQLREAEKKGMN